MSNSFHDSSPLVDQSCRSEFRSCTGGDVQSVIYTALESFVTDEDKDCAAECSENQMGSFHHDE